MKKQLALGDFHAADGWRSGMTTSSASEPKENRACRPFQTIFSVVRCWYLQYGTTELDAPADV